MRYVSDTANIATRRAIDDPERRRVGIRMLCRSILHAQDEERSRPFSSRYVLGVLFITLEAFNPLYSQELPTYLSREAALHPGEIAHVCGRVTRSRARNADPDHRVVGLGDDFATVQIHIRIPNDVWRDTRRSPDMCATGRIETARTEADASHPRPENVGAWMTIAEAGALRPIGTTTPPAAVPTDLPPRLRDSDELAGLLQDVYPEVFADHGVRSASTLWLLVDADGSVIETRLRRTSGYRALDEAAREVGERLAFEPAEQAGQPTDAWISFSFEFSPPPGSVAEDAITRAFDGPPAGYVTEHGPPLAYWATDDSRPESPTIVLLHGGPGATHDYLRPEWDRLASVGRVVYYDQRGCGWSAGGQSRNWQDHVYDLGRLIDGLAPAGPLVLAGSSWGAELALLYALERPGEVAAIVLSGYVGWIGPEPEDADSASPAPPTKRTLVHRPADAWESGSRTLTLAAPEAERPAPLQVSSALGRRLDVCYRANGSTWGSARTMPSSEVLESIAAPVLILGGTERDRVPDGSMELFDQLPNGWLRVIEGAGHDPWFSHPDLVFPTIEGFIEGLPPG